MQSKTVLVPNISCGHCVMTVQNEVGELDGVKSVKADVNTKQVVIEWNAPASWQSISDLLNEIEYPAQEPLMP